MTAKALSAQILTRFPKKFAFCFAYGSGVKKQSGYTEAALKETLIDLIFCVDDPLQWHTQNIAMNPSHYSFMRFLGPSAVSSFQTNYGAKIYCNTLVPIDSNCTIKYGVIAVNDLCNDLSHWTDLYVAGRLHKPVTALVEPNANHIQTAIENNLKSAIRVALVLLPDEFSYYDFFYEIAQMSYKGDFRMVFGENKDKVRNIVQPQLEDFVHLYQPHLETFSHCLHVPKSKESFTDRIKQSKSPDIIQNHLRDLPKNLASRLNNTQNNYNLETRLRASMAQIVFRSGLTQSLKNIPTAGLSKSVRYSWRKALKTFS